MVEFQGLTNPTVSTVVDVDEIWSVLAFNTSKGLRMLGVGGEGGRLFSGLHLRGFGQNLLGCGGGESIFEESESAHFLIVLDVREVIMEHLKNSRSLKTWDLNFQLHHQLRYQHDFHARVCNRAGANHIKNCGGGTC